MRPSNWMDLVCWAFDQSYVWGSRVGEPSKPAGGNPSLRWLYAKYIDSVLATAELNAAAWSTAAAPSYALGGAYNSMANAGWTTAAFGPTGWAIAANLRFPRVVGPGTYGVYGNAAMTFTAMPAAGGGFQTMNLGAPTP